MEKNVLWNHNILHK